MTSTEPQAPVSASERWQPRNWSLRVKLVVVVLVPALLALALGVLRIADKAQEANELGRVSRFVAAQDEVGTLLGELERERYLAAVFVADGRRDPAALQKGFSAVDDARAAATPLLTGLENADLVAVQRERALQALDRLAGLRTLVTSTAPPDSVLSRYNEITVQVIDLNSALLRAVNSADLSGLASALSSLEVARDETSLLQAQLTLAVIAGPRVPVDATGIQSTTARLDTALSNFRVALDADQRARYGWMTTGPANTERERLTAAVLAPPSTTTPTREAVTTGFDAALGEIAKADTAVRSELTATSSRQQDEASNAAGINSVLLLLATLVAGAIVVLISRILLRSLRVLRSTALDVAERRLPRAVESMRAGETPDITMEPVPLTARDEIGQVARAFDAVHGQAVRLAAEQAALQSNVSAMFVNLSRRSQALVERQLQLIEQLESNEQDPDQLSNLFQLDHLATRMRRNSENLLVLAGTDLAKRNVAPVPVVDVLRAAVSEIEQYQRIVVQTPPSATILGRAASDLVHLLAELLDNATQFSPPDSQVVMSTTQTADGSVVMEIADRGVGMAEHELTDANMRLSGPSAVEVSTSRRMGLFVVGRLGARHGVTVRLSDTASGGLTASVTVPSYLVPSTDFNAGRPVGTVRPPTVGGAPAFGVPPQRVGTNGSQREGSLSALVAGADDPSSRPAGAPAALAGPAGPRNGSATALPTRRPGSTLHHGGPAGRPDAGQSTPPARPDRPASAESAAQAGPAEDTRRPGSDETRQAGRDETRQAGRDEPGPAGSGEPRRGQHPFADVLGLADPALTEPAAPREGAGEARNGAPSIPAPSFPPAPPTSPLPIVGRTDSPALPLRQPRPGGTGPQPLPHRRQQPAQDDTAVPSDEQLPMPAQLGDAGRRVSPFPRPDAPSAAPVVTPEPAAALEPPAAAGPGAAATATSEATAEATLAETNPRGTAAVNAASPDARTGPATAAAPGAAAGSAAESTATLESTATRQAGGSAAWVTSADVEATPTATPAAAAQPGTAQPGTARPSGAGEDGAEVPAEVLFAPSVPVIAGPDTRRGAGPGREPDGLDGGETTPIFEEIASAWFRSNRPIPVSWDTDDGSGQQPAPEAPRPAPRPAPGWPSPAAAGPARPAPAPGWPPPAPARPTAAPAPDWAAAPRPAAQQGGRPAPAGAPPARTGGAAPTPAAGPVPQRPLPTPGAIVVPEIGEEAFASAADEGWLAAGAIEAEADRPEELTAAGLPKRRPRARLVPGSAGSAVLAPAAGTSRSAESIRGRLSSYQQGVRQGRESRRRGDAGPADGSFSSQEEPATAGGNHDEESR